jgi:LPXTG-motif cell wall-anchored protein
MGNPTPEPVEPWHPAAADVPPAGGRAGRRIPPKAIVGLVIAAAVIWFAFANTRETGITFWVKTLTAPMWLVLLGTFLAGLLTGWLLRRRRR